MRSVARRFSSLPQGFALIAAIYLVAALACYWQVLNAFFLSDDFILLSAAKKHGPFPQWPFNEAYFFRPIPTLWFWAGLKLFGPNPLGFHLFNVLLLVLDGLLIRAIVRAWFKGAEWVAFFAGLLFIVWPAHAEAVSWVSGCIDGLCTIFTLLACWCLLRGLNQHSKFWIIASVIAAALALLSKESAVATIAVLGLLVLVRRPPQSSLVKIGAIWLALVFVTAGYFLLRHRSLGVWIGGYGHGAHMRFNRPDLVGKVYLNLDNAFLPIGPTYGEHFGYGALAFITLCVGLLAAMLTVWRWPRNNSGSYSAAAVIAILFAFWTANTWLSTQFLDVIPAPALFTVEALLLVLIWMRRETLRAFPYWAGVAAAMVTSLCGLYLLVHVLLPLLPALLVEAIIAAGMLGCWWFVRPVREDVQISNCIALALWSTAFTLLLLAPGVNLSINMTGESSRFAFTASAFSAIAIAAWWKVALAQRIRAPLAGLGFCGLFALLIYANLDWAEAGRVTGNFANLLPRLQPARRVYCLVTPDAIGSAFAFRGGFDKTPYLLGIPNCETRYAVRATYLQRGDKIENRALGDHRYAARIQQMNAGVFTPQFEISDLGDRLEWYEYLRAGEGMQIKTANQQPSDKVVSFDGEKLVVLSP